MGRIRDAWRVLRGTASAEGWDAIVEREDERYILRSEAQDLRQLTLEAASTLDKLVTLAARLAKRDQRAAGAAKGSQGGGPDTPEQPDAVPAATSKLDLYRRAALHRAQQNGGHS